MLNEVRRVFSDFNLRKLDDYLFSSLHFRVEIGLLPGNDEIAHASKRHISTDVIA